MNSLFTIFVAALAFVLSGFSLFAQEATAGLSSPATVVGRPVEMVVTVRDARSAEVPQSLNVLGLRIELMGRSTRFEMNNFKITSSLTYTYSVLPQKSGEFDIPAVEVRVGDKTLKTNPLRISVGEASAMPPPQGLGGPPSAPLPPPGAQAPRGNALPYFGEIVLSKKKAYVGEVIPAEFRYFFSSSIGGEVGDRPNLIGEGFTIQKLANVPKREQIVNGENYIVFAFQTAITPAKVGPLELPSAKLEARLQLPGSAPAGFDDFFRQFGGSAPPRMFTNMQEVAIETAPTSLEISPLPKQGRPDDFSGAIGKFKMEATVSPKKAGPGDPVTLRVVVSGQGNFEAMGPPVLVDGDEWRSYPPSEKFQSSDAINYAGDKTYEFLIVARTDQQQTPGMAFTYLDPDTGTYETLTQAPLSVQARAGQAPAKTAETSLTVNQSATPEASSQPNPSLPSQSGGASSWTPILVHPAFTMVNTAIGVIWILSLAMILIQRHAVSASSLRRKKVQRLKATLASLESCPANEFTPRAVAHLLAVLDTHSKPLEAAVLLAKLSMDADIKSVLLDLLSRDEESKYSPRASKVPDRATRTNILSALKKIPV